MARNSRGISTVVDVAMALFLITASIGIVMAFLDTGGPPPDPQEADQTAATLAGTTMHVNYSVANIRNEPEFPNNDYNDTQFERSEYGASSSMIASATVSSVRIDGERLSNEGKNFARGVRGNVRTSLTAMDGKTRVVALYRHYPNSTVTSRMTIGPKPPGNADISTVTMDVASDIPPVNESKVESRFGSSSDYDAVGTLLAKKVVKGYFPLESTQLALEADNTTQVRRAQVVYRYQRMANITRNESDPNFDPDDSSNPISQQGADAQEANARLVDGLEEIIADNLRNSFDSPSKEELADEISTGKVTLTIQTWKTQEEGES